MRWPGSQGPLRGAAGYARYFLLGGRGGGVGRGYTGVAALLSELGFFGFVGGVGINAKDAKSKAHMRDMLSPG